MPSGGADLERERLTETLTERDTASSLPPAICARQCSKGSMKVAREAREGRSPSAIPQEAIASSLNYHL